MSILFEFVPSIFVALAFDFVLYITGASLLRAFSFGICKYHLHNYGDFKRLKVKPNNGYLIPYIVGVIFYALIVVSIAWLN